MRILRIVALLLIVVSASLASAQTPTPDPATIMQDCIEVLRPERPNETGPDAPTIKIVAPVSGSIVRSSEETFATINFSVETQNFDLPETELDEASERHWHLWLNNGVWAMYYQSEVVGSIPYGTWRVCAVMADAEHIDMGMPDAIMLTVERTESGETIVIPPSAQGIVSPISLIVVAVVTLASVGAGYWVGFRSR